MWYNGAMKLVELGEQEVKNLDFGCENFLQSWEMYQRYQGTGRQSYFVGVKADDGRVLAAGLMLAKPWRLGKKIFRVAGGWLMDYDAEDYRTVLEFITREAEKFVKQRGGIALEIAPNIIAEPRDAHNQVLSGKTHLDVKQALQSLGYKYLGEYEQVKWTFALGIEGKNAEELFKAFRTDHRQRIRRAEREGVRVRELADNEIGILKQIAAEAGQRHGFQDPDENYYHTMKQYFGKKVEFVVAELPAEKVDGKEGNYVPLAAAMFVNDGREMVYLYSGSVRDLQKYGGAHLIQWQMIQKAIKTGCKKYNFYGVYPVEGNGVYSFKQGFRGNVEELLGTFILPIGWLGKLYVMRLKPQEYGAVH